jgi:hypothetical protein
MKRCPQCEFIYPDADKVCDFDRTTLVEAEESEIAQITNTPERPKLSDLAATHSKNFAERKSRKALPIAAASGLILGIAMVSGYLTLQHLLDLQVIARIEPIEVRSVIVEIPKPTLKPSTVEPSAPEQVSSLPAKSEQTAPQSTTQSRSSAGPISTGTTGNSSKSQIIVLTSGTKVDADQVWRTKDGVWYRKNGIVTLLKKNRVKTIVDR